MGELADANHKNRRQSGAKGDSKQIAALPGAQPEMTIQTTGLTLLLVGLVLFWLAVRRIRLRQPVSGVIVGVSSIAVLVMGALAVGFATSFYVLDQFTSEQDIGDITLTRTAPRVFQATLVLDNNSDTREFRLAGDEWSLQVRFLKWQYPATLVGLESLFQLDQIRGRYDDPQAHRELELTAYRLTKQPGPALWRLVRSGQHWLPWIDAVYGSAVYMPMVDGARYRISVTTSGLIARPENEAARRAVRDW